MPGRRENIWEDIKIVTTLSWYMKIQCHELLWRDERVKSTPKWIISVEVAHAEALNASLTNESRVAKSTTMKCCFGAKNLLITQVNISWSPSWLTIHMCTLIHTLARIHTRTWNCLHTHARTFIRYNNECIPWWGVNDRGKKRKPFNWI